MSIVKKEIFDQADVGAITDSHKFSIGLGGGTPSKTLTWSGLVGFLNAVDWVFSGNCSFSNKVEVANGTSGAEAVNYQQLGLSYVNYNDTDKKVTVGGVSRKDALGATFGFLFISDSYTPSGAGDTNGGLGAITWDDNNIYVKTNLGWSKSPLTLL